MYHSNKPLLGKTPVWVCVSSLLYSAHCHSIYNLRRANPEAYSLL